MHIKNRNSLLSPLANHYKSPISPKISYGYERLSQLSQKQINKSVLKLPVDSYTEARKRYKI